MNRPLAVAALSLLAAAPAAAAERNFPVGGFDRLALEGSPDVTVVTGRAPSVRATGDADALDRLDVHVEGGTLRIGHKRNGWNWDWGRHARTHVEVTVPMLRGVDTAGSGDVRVDRIKVRDFAGAIAGSGSLTVAVRSMPTPRASPSPDREPRRLPGAAAAARPRSPGRATSSSAA